MTRYPPERLAMVSRQRLPEGFEPWLAPPRRDPYDTVVYESHEWVRRISDEDLPFTWQSYLEILQNLNLRHADPGRAPLEWPGLELHTGRDHKSIVLARLPITRDAILLIAPFKGIPSIEDIQAAVERIEPLYSGKIRPNSRYAQELSVNDVAPFAGRSYPSFIWAGDKEWLAIEQDAETNLALSAEEEDLLWSASTRDGGLPIFINGRAGSGKSTMLSYLFADYCDRKYRERLPGDLLFLTYNERLVEQAKRCVDRLLTLHPNFLIADEHRRWIDGFFQPFRTFLLRLLPPDERRRFALDRYISFREFKRLYDEPDTTDALRLPERKEWPAELCWHVIRAFIKGYSRHGHLGADDYEHDVPRRDQTVPPEVFRAIHGSVWQHWYQGFATAGQWDDQDLIRTVLDCGRFEPKYAVVFCDEAQDFTRLELQFVMRLSIFSRFDLRSGPKPSVPFAFAGDPLQTLNPTGFRWSRAQAAFYAEIIEPLAESRLGMNPGELSFNYRSTPAIVKVSNTIQLWRHVLLGIEELTPQRWWYQREGVKPQKYILGRNLTAEQLQDLVRNTIVIVPCEEGGERRFLESDDALIGLAGDAGEPPKNVISAVTAKGLEFPKVVLYKFGEHCDEATWGLIPGQAETSLKHQYFFNKLYVAATRAKSWLFVIDSESGDHRLWSRAQREPLSAFVNRATSPDLWRDAIASIELAPSEAAEDIREQDLEAIAQELEREGKAQSDADLLRRAKQYYEAMGRDRDAARCEAWALRAEAKFSKAGSLFLKWGYYADARESFWTGRCWAPLDAYFRKAYDARERQAGEGRQP